MENVISTFDLEVLSKKYDVRIWLCKKTGKRWSFIIGAGEQRSLPSELIFEEDEYGVFVQGESYDEGSLIREIQGKFTAGKKVII